MKLSIVSTLYKSAQTIDEFYERVTSAAQELVGDDYEIILVNDGSPDNSLGLAINITEQDARVIVVDLSRNFGHHRAMLAGLSQASGDRIFLIDSDLEEEPEWITDFSTTMDHEMVDVVYGVQEARKGGWFERWSGRIFYSVFNYLANIEHPRDIVTARIMSRRYVDALLKFQEREVVISCLWVITGFKQFGKLVRKHESSTTTYSISKKVEHAVNAITSFSEAPLRLIFSLGLLILTGSIIYAFFLALQRVFLGGPLDGWTSVMMSIWLLGGTIVFFLGVIGLYVSKIFSETKQRPSFIVRQVHGQAFARD